MTAPDRPLQGLLWMVATGLCFVAVNALVKLVGTGVPAPQQAFLRFAFGAVFLSPALAAAWRAGLPQGTGPLFLARGAAHSVAVCLWFFAMARLPVAEAVSIGYLNPVLVTLAAALVFGETLGPRRLAALAVAGAGALVILRPGLREVTAAHLAQIGAAVFFAASYLFAKHLGGRVRPVSVVAILSATVTVCLLPLAVAVWVPVAARELGFLALVAAFATAGQYTMMRAFAAAPMAVTQPAVFLQVVWASALGALAFGEPVDPWVLAGAAIIIAAICALAWREAQAREAAG